jgi:uncharacterized membrane protein
MDEDEFKKAFIARRAAQQPIENRRIETAVLETAVDKAVDRTRRLEKIETAQKALATGVPQEVIATITGLSTQEVALLAQGQPLAISSETDD